MSQTHRKREREIWCVCGSVCVATTLPTLVANAELLAGQVTVAVVGAAAVVAAVGDVAGLTLPVLVALAVHTAGDGVPRRALAVARAVVRTGVYPAQGFTREKERDRTS